MKCAFCGVNIPISGKISRNDTCPNCRKTLRCCKQCNFYDPNAYNECREVSAERVVDNERPNFCDYFVPKGTPRGRINRVQDAKNALEALFKK